MTEIKNLPLLKSRYLQAQQSNLMYAMVNMNIKKFRYMNYVHGKEKADQVLEDVMKVIQATLKEEDFAVRLQGDDFIILKSYDSRQELEFGWLRSLIDDLFEIENEVVFHNIYTSFGIYQIENKIIKFEEALEKTIFSRIMTESMQKRVFCYEFYDEKMYQNYMDSCYLEEYTAKANRDGLYQVYIQPKVDTITKEIIGGEALLRLFDKNNTMIPISSFLPVLNKNGYIRNIDLVIMEKVLKKMDERILEGKRNVPISFNISNSFFYDEYLIRDYKAIADRYQINNDFIELEFMESIHMDEGKLKDYIEDFHEAGFRCALDDFGNGFSNFSLLKDCKLDIIKVDRCFFEKELDDDGKEILRTILHLIKYLGMGVVAEGVERKEDVEFLESIHCDAIQGFYFYQPMPMKDFFDLLDKKRGCNALG